MSSPLSSLEFPFPFHRRAAVIGPRLITVLVFARVAGGSNDVRYLGDSMKSFLLAAAAAIAVAAPAFAGDQDFRLVNRTGYDIAEVYVSPSATNRWGKDVMGHDTLDDGESVNISFAHDAQACHWDMKVVYTDNDTAEWGDINLCKISKITIHWNRKTGETTADGE
jgi:hypothetical protein